MDKHRIYGHKDKERLDMKRWFILGGSIFVTTILILMSFTSTVIAKTVDRTDIINKITNKLENNKGILGSLLLYLLSEFYIIAQYYYNQTGHFSPIISLLMLLLEIVITPIFALFLIIAFILEVLLPIMIFYYEGGEKF